MKWWLLVVLAGCGDNRAPPDAALAVPAFTPGCTRLLAATDEPFLSASDFEGEVVPGTLAGWNPDGRWFFTETYVERDSQSLHLERRGEGVILDKRAEPPGTMTADVLFHRFTHERYGRTETVTTRISNRGPDGALRADVATCSGDGNVEAPFCNVCTARLVRAERHDPEPSENLMLVGEHAPTSWAGTISLNVRVVDNLAYVARSDGLYIVDISDLAHPVQRSHYANTFTNDVKLVEGPGGRRYAILADSPVDIVDVTDPAEPSLAAIIPQEAHTLFTETRGGKTYVYLASSDATASVFDVTDPVAPVRRGRYMTDGFAMHDLSVVDGVAYLSAWDAGFLIVDFTDPTAPVLKGTWQPTTGGSHSNWTTMAGGRKIAVHGDEGYGSYLEIVDIDPASATYMKPFASYKTRDHISIHNIMAFGTKAYFTYYQDGVRVLDIADPAHPKLVGYFNTWDPQSDAATGDFYEGAFGLDVDLARKLIFVADSTRGLLILRDDT